MRSPRRSTSTTGPAPDPSKQSEKGVHLNDDAPTACGATQVHAVARGPVGEAGDRAALIVTGAPAQQVAQPRGQAGGVDQHGEAADLGDEPSPARQPPRSAHGWPATAERSCLTSINLWLTKTQVDERCRRQEERAMSDEDFARRLETIDRRQEAFLQRLDTLDQRDTALLQRLERLNDRLDVLAGQTGQIVDTLVEHRADPHAHE